MTTLGKRYLINFVLILAFLIGVSSPAIGQVEDPSLLSLDRIFSGSEFSPKYPRRIQWTGSGDTYTALEASLTVKNGSDLISYNIETKKRSILITAEKLIPKGLTEPLSIQGFQWSAGDKKALIYTNSKKVWRLNTRGDYWVLDMTSGDLTKLGGDAEPSTLMFAKFSPDGSRVGYVHENNIYVQDLSNGKITQLTADGSRTLINGTSDWVNEEELYLRDCWRWSPDGRSIAYWQFNSEGIKDFILINDTLDLYPKLTYIPYPKAGTTNSAVRIGVVSSSGGETRWIKTPGDPRQNYIAMMDWTDSSNEIILQYLNRLQNQNQLMIADAKTGGVHTILTEKDKAWVDVTIPEMKWVDGGKRFLWMSDRDGWQHVYSVSRDGSDTKLITPGNFDVIDMVSLDEAGGWLYFMASPTNATQRYLYRTRLDGTRSAERMTAEDQTGWHDYSISPNNRWAVNSYSSFGKAPKVEVVDLKNKSVLRPLADNSELQTKLNDLKQGPQEFFKIDIGEGVTLDGWMMKPPNFDAAKKYPILFYVYGEPAGQTVKDQWAGSNYLWFLMLTQQGYIVASVDNRGTPAPRGREWRKSIYRKIGVISSKDQANAVKAITAKMPFVDADRVGIWGWSGGGSSTLNALFRYPDIYKMGMAVAPVPDMRLYDTIYQERYMGLPQDDGDAYEQGSPITFAKNLNGDLLIVHGTGDDNVHYQGTERLINELIKNNKQFSMMAYPNRTHGIFEGENTTRHLYGLLTKYLKEHL